MEKSTAEHLFNGQIKLRQPADGYRYSIDPIILAAHTDPPAKTRIIDIGTGCGIIPLILGFRHNTVTATGVEIQEELARIASHNAAVNLMSDRIHILNKDISEVTLSDTMGKADLILSNPPYKKLNSGRLNPNRQKAVARHEIKLNLEQLIQNADRLTTPKGQIIMIYPADRISDLIQAMNSFRFSLNWIRFVHTKQRETAKRVVASAVKNTSCTCTIRPPLYLYDDKLFPTKEHLALFRS